MVCNLTHAIQNITFEHLKKDIVDRNQTTAVRLNIIFGRHWKQLDNFRFNFSSHLLPKTLVKGFCALIKQLLRPLVYGFLRQKYKFWPFKNLLYRDELSPWQHYWKLYFTANSGWAFNSISCRVRCNGWIDCIARQNDRHC